MSAITTHVLDTAQGRPAAGVPVLLERTDGDGWLRVGGGATDTDGRARLGDVAPGHHRLTFETSGWSGFYPQVVIHFTVAAGEDHYHVPLLLSPYGYGTYRGELMLGANRYGKSDVRVVKVIRGEAVYKLRDLVVDVALEGDFTAAHTEGDNTGLLATDTMRNTVYALARTDPLDHLEAFGRALVERFVEAGPTVTNAHVRIAEHPWSRLTAHAFQRGSGGTRLVTVSGPPMRYEGGIDDLLVLRTTGSGWAGFHREEYTTLPETDDRIMATVVTARWECAEAPAESTWAGVRDTILEAFGDHYSPSVQFTLHRMGKAVLDRFAGIERIHFSLPNRHHLLYDLERFGLDNPNVIFHSTTEPYGLIEGTVER